VGWSQAQEEVAFSCLVGNKLAKVHCLKFYGHKKSLTFGCDSDYL